MRPLLLPALLIITVLALSACTAKGSMTLFKAPDETAFTMTFEAWSATQAYEWSQDKGDTLQIEIAREKGAIGLTISGKNGSKPYAGRDLQTGLFTVSVYETDTYVLTFTAEQATGKAQIKRLERE